MKLSGSHLLSFGWLSQHRQKGIKRGSVTLKAGQFCRPLPCGNELMSKGFQMVRVRDSTQEIW
jgi:hypothetical protein